MATLPWVMLLRHSAKPDWAAPDSPWSRTRPTQNFTAFSNSGESRRAFQPSSNQVPPKVFTTVVSGAITSPQPGRPRRQMPFMPDSAPSTFAARSATWVQVGCAGIVRHR
jgi:hypothetical protein